MLCGIFNTHVVPGKRIKHSSKMVTNPIYDHGDPVYETIHQEYNKINSSPRTKSTCNSSRSPATSYAHTTRYSSDPTNHQVEQQVCNTANKHPRHERNKLQLTLSLNDPFPSVLPDKGEKGTTKSPVGDLDKSSHTAKQTSQRIDSISPPQVEDEKYIVMNPAKVICGFEGTLNGKQGETSPELTKKYHD